MIIHRRQLKLGEQPRITLLLFKQKKKGGTAARRRGPLSIGYQLMMMVSRTEI